jgi:hypothetical protein
MNYSFFTYIFYGYNLGIAHNSQQPVQAEYRLRQNGLTSFGNFGKPRNAVGNLAAKLFL